MGVVHLWAQYFRYELILQEFLWVYRAFQLVKEFRFFSLSAKQGRKSIDRCLRNNKGRKKKFFNVSTSRLYDSDPGSNIVCLRSSRSS